MKWELLARYVSRQTNEAENKQIRSWIRKSPDNEEMYFFMRRMYASSLEDEYVWDSEASWKRFQIKVAKKTDLSETQGAFKSKSRPGVRTFHWGAVAAILALVLFSSLLIFYQEEVISNDVVVYRTVEAEQGSRTRIQLADGTEVVLKPGSRVTFPESFKQLDSREVTLSGGAFFDVKPNPDKPFLVESDMAVTRVLGTRFFMRSYPDVPTSDIYVFSGSVRVKGKDMSDIEAVELGKNQHGSIKNGNAVSVTGMDDSSRFLLWLDGELAFYDESLDRVFTMFERWYGIRIEVKPEDQELFEKKLTASFHQRQPIEEVLEAVSITLGIRYEEKDNSYHFTY